MIIAEDKKRYVGGNMATIKTTKQNFETEVLQADKTVVLDFWAPWCGPCRMIGPVIEELSQECTDIKFAKLNVDEEPEIAEQYSIMSIPTLILFKNGEAVKRLSGTRGKEELQSKQQRITWHLQNVCRCGKVRIQNGTDR